MKYFGYGYIKNADQIVPFIPINFWAFRTMVGLGCLFILVFAVMLFILYKKDITRPRWFAIRWSGTHPIGVYCQRKWLVGS